MKNRPKYPLSLFILGFISNIFGRFFFLFFLSVILLIIGIWVKLCLWIGLGILALDILLSFIEQLMIRHATIHSTNPNFMKYRDAILSDDWRGNVGKILNDEISNQNKDDTE